MGQAKKRGTFEQRNEEAIKRESEEMAKLEAEFKLRRQARPPGKSRTAIIAAAMAVALSK